MCEFELNGWRQVWLTYSSLILQIIPQYWVNKGNSTAWAGSTCYIGKTLEKWDKKESDWKRKHTLNSGIDNNEMLRREVQYI
jgi:hypothetical protein